MGSDLRGLPIIGRESEIERVDLLLAAVLDGGGRSIFIEGEAGIGKTRLVDEVLTHAVDRGFKVLRGSARELEAERPFAILADAFSVQRGRDEERQELSGLLRGTHDEAARFRLDDLFLDLLELEAAGPRVLVLEDLHWADPESIRVLGRILGQIRTFEVAVVATARPHPRSDALAKVIRSFDGVLHLSPLSSGAAEELAEMVAGDLVAEARERIGSAGGNPLFITELAAVMHEMGASLEPFPRSLRLVILGRLSSLPPASMDALKAASTIGTSFEIEVLAKVLGADQITVEELLNPPIEEGFVGAGEDALRFRHDLVRAAVYGEIPPASRVDLHKRAARALDALGRPPVEAALHLLHGSSSGDVEAVRDLIRVADDTLALSPATSLTLAQRASSIAPGGSTDEAKAAVLVVRSLQGVGRNREASARALEAMLHPSLQQEDREGLIASLCLALLYQGDQHELDRITEELLRLPTLTDRERALLLGYRASIGKYTGNRKDEALDEAERISSALGLHPSEVDLDCARARLLLADGKHKEAAEIFRESLAYATSRGDLRGIARARELLALCLAPLDEAVAGLRELKEAQRIYLELGDETAAYNLGFGLWLIAGEWDELLTQLEVAERLGEERGSHVPGMHAMRALIKMTRDLSGWEDDIERSHAEMDALGNRESASLTLLAELTALELGESLTPKGLRAPLDPRSASWIGPVMVRVAMEAGQADLARDYAGLVQEIAEQLGSIRARAALAFIKGRMDQDGAALLESLDLYDQIEGYMLERGMANLDVARLQSDATERRRCLERARSDFEVLGATRLLRLCDEVEGRAGGSRRDRPVVGWGSLTDSERNVAFLVAKGFRNKQIAEHLVVSVRTVETHVSNALRKMQVQTRVELAAAALAAHPESVQGVQ